MVYCKITEDYYLVLTNSTNPFSDYYWGLRWQSINLKFTVYSWIKAVMFPNQYTAPHKPQAVMISKPFLVLIVNNWSVTEEHLTFLRDIKLSVSKEQDEFRIINQSIPHWSRGIYAADCKYPPVMDMLARLGPAVITRWMKRSHRERIRTCIVTLLPHHYIFWFHGTKPPVYIHYIINEV